MRTNKRRFLSDELMAILALSALVGCGDDAPADSSDAGSTSTSASTSGSPTSADSTGPSGGSTETGVAEDSTGPSGTTTGDNETGSSDTGMEAACPFPNVQVAGTPDTNALADAPAACGAPAYSWSRSDELGTVGDLGLAEPFDVDFLNALFVAQGITLAPPPSHTVAMQQFSYVTQDRGELLDATGLVAFPTDLDPDAAPNEVVLFLHGTTGLADGCGASEELEQQAIASLFAAYGYTAVMPDYIGLGYLGTETADPHPYLVGEATAIAALDAVRAAARLDPADRGDTCMSERFAVFGGSQGGHAALWVDRLAPYYAPELDLVGVVATVPPAALLRETEFVFSNFVSGTGNLTAAMVAMASWYGVEDQLSQLFVPPWAADLPDLLVGACDLDVAGLPTELAGLLQPEIIAAAGAGTLGAVDPWGCMARENDITATGVARLDDYPESYGVMFVTGESDTLVNTPIERAGYDDMCAAGLPLTYLECAGASHSEASFYSLPESLAFISARFAGEAFETVCPVTPAVTCEGTPGA